MNPRFTRREILRSTALGGACLGIQGLTGYSKLSPVDAAETRLPVGAVQFHPEIEPLVRLLEETPRDQLLEQVAARVKNGLNYRDLLAALFLAGIRNVQPRPAVGFKFHAVLVVNSAHLASVASPAEHRWLPIFWALDQFKSSQAADEREGNWTMPAIDDGKLPAAPQALAEFTTAMDRWDESAADAAVAAVARSASLGTLFEQLFRYGARDFRSIGHKAIYASNSWRTLGTIGREHVEPIARSLAYAMLNREGDAGADRPADRPWRRNNQLVDTLPATWRHGQPNDSAVMDLLSALRTEDDEAVCKLVADQLRHGVGVQSIWDAYFLAAAELLVRQPGIVALHAVTSTNALRFAFDTVVDDRTRRLILLQNAAFLALFRREPAMKNKEFRLDKLAAVPLADAAAAEKSPAAAVDELCHAISQDRLQAAGKLLGYLEQHPDPRPFLDAARVLVFRKGTDSHDYKFSSAIMEDYLQISPQWRARYLAASVFNLRGAEGPDNPLVERIKSALA